MNFCFCFFFLWKNLKRFILSFSFHITKDNANWYCARKMAEKQDCKTPENSNCSKKKTTKSPRLSIHKMVDLLLLGYTNGASTTASCFGVLTTNTEAPVMSHTAMGTDLLQSFQIFTELGVQIGRSQLLVFTINDVLLSVQEPVGDFVLAWVRDDCDNFVNLQCGEETWLFAGQVIRLRWGLRVSRESLSFFISKCF